MGQANCSTLHLPNGNIIIIDTGNRGSPLIDWLGDRRCHIEAVAITHNDADHVGALPSLLDAYEARISNVSLLTHKTDFAWKGQKLFRRLEQSQRKGVTVSRLETGAIIWEDSSLSASLRVVHPSMLENYRASTPNRTSAIIVLEIGGSIEVIWPGDASLTKLQDHCSGSMPFFLVGPHHGGPEEYRTQAGLSAIKAVRPRKTFMSVSTKNQYHHPRPKYVRRLEMEGSRVSCSQMTVHCCRKQILQIEKPLMQSHAALGLRPPRNRGITCRGPVRIAWDGARFVEDSLAEEHQTRIQGLRRAQCLKGRRFERF